MYLPKSHMCAVAVHMLLYPHAVCQSSISSLVGTITNFKFLQCQTQQFLCFLKEHLKRGYLFWKLCVPAKGMQMMAGRTLHNRHLLKRI